MKRFLNDGIRLNTQQDVVNVLETSIDGLRSLMADNISNRIQEIIREDDLNDEIDSYLEKQWLPDNQWSFARQFIIVAILDAYQHGSSALALPPNQSFLPSLISKLAESGIVFQKTTKIFMLQDFEEKNQPLFYEDDWNFYHLIMNK